ncbi:MAG: hypothetical protein DWQ56_15800 [Microcystis aeruginosa DA14]|uniref:Uncharacterized protein n=1 Tax=Microcystis aeruginosa DA14 TaxID=1987506 RepID=A0A3E0M7H0_MICAE|nr:MAG: hypothetical protein DWQ56_15800 [Microcystis aeruginosa DA14]
MTKGQIKGAGGIEPKIHFKFNHNQLLRNFQIEAMTALEKALEKGAKNLIATVIKLAISQ